MSGLINIGEKAPAVSSGLIIAGSQLDDETILQCFAEAGMSRDGRPISFDDAIASIVAEKLLELRLIKGGGRLVSPTSGLITRTLRDGCLDESLGDDGTLVALRKRIAEAARASDVMKDGLKLGDRGVHFAAGWGGGHLRQTMDRKERLNYGAGMAKAGYSTALVAAQAHKADAMSGIVRATAPLLIENMGPVISVMMAINPRVRDIINELERKPLEE